MKKKYLLALAGFMTLGIVSGCQRGNLPPTPNENVVAKEEKVQIANPYVEYDIG